MNPYQVLGISESATDAEVKKAYLNLARKYHPDNYHDNPLADLAQEKMKEINAAHEAITKQRSGGGNTGYTQNGGYGGGGYTGSYSSSSVLQQARAAINAGQVVRAEALLNNYQDHNGEWNFLKGALAYRKGWMDEAKTYYQTACQMEPNNMEYRRALEYMKSGTRTSYSPNGKPFGSTTVCVGGDPCQTMCCGYMLCQLCGCGGYRMC
ncbi:DnaJ domain-containing protein [Bengtsoniella intestinalis]|uniref:J domain-containing protein n=1 Tax=Bengtsoniella intestinalis TaxID=3073143 RepID=UPI00391F3803